jgi:chromosomal replication initiator protein
MTGRRDQLPLFEGSLPTVTAPARDNPSIADIRLAVCDHFGLSLNDLLSQRKGPREARPRQVAMFLCRELTPHTQTVIAHHFGDRDYSTAGHAIRTVERRLKEGDQATIDAVRAVRAKLDTSLIRERPRPARWRRWLDRLLIRPRTTRLRIAAEHT